LDGYKEILEFKSSTFLILKNIISNLFRKRICHCLICGKNTVVISYSLLRSRKTFSK
jgi:hypothetical protein